MVWGWCGELWGCLGDNFWIMSGFCGVVWGCCLVWGLRGVVRVVVRVVMGGVGLVVHPFLKSARKLGVGWCGSRVGGVQSQM